MSGTVIVINPDGSNTRHEWNGALDRDGMPDGPQGAAWMHKLLGGYLELVEVEWEGVMCRGFVDEDGMRKNLPDNMLATALVDRKYIEHSNIIGKMLIWIPPR